MSALPPGVRTRVPPKPGRDLDLGPPYALAICVARSGGLGVAFGSGWLLPASAEPRRGASSRMRWARISSTELSRRTLCPGRSLIRSSTPSSLRAGRRSSELTVVNPISSNALAYCCRPRSSSAPPSSVMCRALAGRLFGCDPDCTCGVGCAVALACGPGCACGVGCAVALACDPDCACGVGLAGASRPVGACAIDIAQRRQFLNVPDPASNQLQLEVVRCKFLVKRPSRGGSHWT
mmetsp:Transcript_21808/g.51739  ORF Transcript_21808/g.51739 Transcript_21808/m.51739 type:complete len:236 (+) Transcript_21808:2507-3214(+)